VTPRTTKLKDASKPKQTDKVKTTLGKLAAADQALTRLAQRALPTKPAYHIAKLARLASVEIELFYKQRNDLIKELGEERDTTPQEKMMGHQAKVMQVLPANEETYQARLQELSDIEVTLPWAPIDLEALGELVIMPADIIALGALLKDAA